MDKRYSSGKMLFFRTQADEADVDGIDDQLCIPASRLVSMSPASITTIEMLFHSVKNNILQSNEQLTYDKVTLTVTRGDVQEVMDALVQKINSYPHSNGFIVIADDCATTDSAVTALANNTLPTSYAHPSISGIASITVAAKLHQNYKFTDIGTGGVAPTALTTAGELAVNTHYSQSVTAARAHTLPSAVTTKAGDWITVLYLAAIANTLVQTYTVHADDSNFALGSRIRIIGEDGTRIPVIDTAVANDDEVKLTGLNNGDCGIGTYLRFVNTSGTANGWAVDCVVEGQGTKAVASANTLFTS